MLKFKQLTAASVIGAVALSSSLYATNYGVGLQKNKWQLVGITGLHSYSSGGGSSIANLNIGSIDMALIDLVDSADRITWDANNSRGNAASNPDYNGYFGTLTDWSGGAVTPQTKLFTDDGTTSGSGIMFIENNGSTTGMPYHSIIGLKAMNHTDSDLQKAAISFNYDPKVNYKAYESPMRVMYIRSDRAQSATSMPDVMITYQATMEGQTFKVQFSTSATNDTSSGQLPFIWTDSTQTDTIYTGTFNVERTWDNPAISGDGLSATTNNSTADTGTPFASISGAFDANLTNNRQGTYTGDSSGISPYGDSGLNFDPTNTYSPVQALEGNLTVYEWSNNDVLDKWLPAWFYNNGGTAIVADSLNEIPNNEFTVGKGYWVKFDEYAGAQNKASYASSNPSIPGLLVSDNMTASDYSSSIVKPGWNLLSFEDAALRYSTTGLAVPAASADDINITGPYGEKYLSFQNLGITAATPSTPEMLAACQEINLAIDGNNSQATNSVALTNSQRDTSTLNIRCYPATNDVTPYLLFVSDKQFSLDLPTSVSTGITTLAGGTLPVHDKNITFVSNNPQNIEGTGIADAYRWNSRYGEYLLGLKVNQMLLTETQLASNAAFQLSLPTFETTAGTVATTTVPLAIGWSSSPDASYGNAITNQTVHTAAYTNGVASLLGSASSVSYNLDITNHVNAGSISAGAAMGTVWQVPTDFSVTPFTPATGAATSADGNETLFIAMNKRFYARDYTFIRIFDIDDTAETYEWGVSVSGAGSVTQATVHNISQYGVTPATDVNCTAISLPANAITVGTSTVQPFCIDANNSAQNDLNDTVMFITDGNNGAVSIRNYDVREANESDASKIPNVSLGAATYPNIDIMADYTVSQAESEDGDDYVYGAIMNAYTGTKLATATVESTGSLTISNSGTDAGTTNLTYTPIWAQDFPNDGPIYYLTQVPDGAGFFLKPEAILTAITAGDIGYDNTADHGQQLSNNEITWKAVDATRNPAEWFDDATGFDLFWTESGRGYWVYATAGFDPTNAADIMTGTTSSTIRSYHHFDNDPNSQGYATTTNHVDGELTTTVTNLYRNSTNGQTFTSGQSVNVEATIGGSKSSMLTTSGISAGSQVAYTTTISDYETPGVSISGSGSTAVTIQAVDGLGGKDTESTTLPLVKPGQPVLTTDATNPAITYVTSSNSGFAFIFENNISDVNYQTQLLLEYTGDLGSGVTAIDTSNATFTSKFSFPAALAPESAPVTLDGLTVASSVAIPATPTKDLRFVASTAASSNIGTNNPIFLSDQFAQAFAPVYAATHVLSVSAAGEYDADPKDFSATTPALLGEDHGVALTGVGSNTVALAYPPATGDPDLAGFTKVLHVGTKDGVLTQISYTSQYVGKYFFLYSESAGVGKMYWGVFPSTDLTTVSSTDSSGNQLWYRLVEISGSTQSIVK